MVAALLVPPQVIAPSIPVFPRDRISTPNTRQAQAERLIEQSLKLADVFNPFSGEILTTSVRRAIIDAHCFSLTGIASLSDASVSLSQNLLFQEGVGRDFFPEPHTDLLITLLAGAIPFSNHYLSNPVSKDEYYNVSWAMRRAWEMKDRRNLNFIEGSPHEVTSNIFDYVNQPIWDALTTAIPTGRPWHERRTDAFNEDCNRAKRAFTSKGLWNINTEFYRNLRTEFSNTNDTTGYQLAILEELNNMKWREVGSVVLDTIIEDKFSMDEIHNLYDSDLLISICNTASKKLHEQTLLNTDNPKDILLLVLSAINILRETQACAESEEKTLALKNIETNSISTQMQNIWRELIGNPDVLGPEKWGILSKGALDVIKAVYLQNNDELGNPANFSWASESLHSSVTGDKFGEIKAKPWNGDHEKPYWDLPYHMRYNYVLLLSTAALQFHRENPIALEKTDIHDLTKTWIKSLWRSVERDYRASFDFDLASECAVEAMNTVLGTEGILTDISDNDFNRICSRLLENIKIVKLWGDNHVSYSSKTFKDLPNDSNSNAKNNVALIALAAMNARAITQTLALAA